MQRVLRITSRMALLFNGMLLLAVAIAAAPAPGSYLCCAALTEQCRVGGCVMAQAKP